MNDDITREVPFVGPETTLEIALPVADEDDPLWVRFLCALAGTAIGFVLAVAFLYGVFLWWLS